MNAWTRFLETVERSPDRIALIQGERNFTFRQIGNCARNLSKSLAGIDLPPGSPCVASGGNGFEMACIIPAIWSLGGVPVLLGRGSPAGHLRRVCEMTGAACVLAAEPVTDHDSSTPDCPVLDGSKPIVDHASELRQVQAGYSVEPNQPGSIILTSGSTGLPKGVFQTHGTLIERSEAVARSLGYRTDDRLLCPVPWSHDYGWGQLLSLYFLGIQMALPEMPGPLGVSQAIEISRPTIIGGVPSLYAGLVRTPTPIREVDRSSVRLLTSTGSKFPKAVLEEIRTLFQGAEIALNYGLTETYRSTSLKPEEIDTKPGSVGRAIEGVRITISKEDGTDALPGEMGEVIHHGAGVFAGYWRDIKRTDLIRKRSSLSSAGESIFQVSTGDIGWLDENGYLYLQGRRDRVIKTMDSRVCLDEIESSLLECMELAEVAVFDITHEIMGSMIIAAIVLKEGCEHNDRPVRIHSREYLPPAMRPRTYHILDKLPRTPSGKTDYPLLRELYGANASNA